MDNQPYSQYPQSQPVQQRKFMPQDSIEYNSLITEPSWGKQADIPQELKDKISITEYAKNNDGSLTQIGKQEFWELLGYYTRDMRLANLSSSDLYYCSEWLDIAGDCLREGYVQSFITALARVVTRLELSQSKGGFLRKRMNTNTIENKQRFDEVKKPNLFGKSKGGN